MFPDFKDLLFALNANRVRYLVVGGQAVVHHAQPRTTKDLDILIEPTTKNGAALVRALREFGAPMGNLTAADFVESGSFYTMGIPPVAIDILPVIKGVGFAAAWKNRVPVVVDASTGLTANFISSADLITAKLASGRAQDLGDVEALRQAAKSSSPAKTKRKPGPKKKV